MSENPDNRQSEMVHLLTPEGQRVEHPDFRFDGDDETIKGLLRDMVLVRRLDMEATSLQRQGELGLWPPCLGQEATQVATGKLVTRNDMVFPAFREHGIAWALGVDPGDMLAMFRGTAMATTWDEEEKRMQHYTVIIGAQMLHGVGYAMGLDRDGMVGNANPEDNGAVVAVVGDGGMSQGDTNEAFVFASSYRAPVVFVCSNNQWAISEPVSLQSPIPLYQRARGFGMPGVQVDGNDVLAVTAVMRWAMERARSGQGPALVECYTYRVGAHTTSDDPTKYRLAEEGESWKPKDPIERVKKYLLSTGAIDDAWLAQLDSDADDLGEQIRATCKSLPNPKMDSVFEHLYVSKTDHLARQQREWDEYEASFADAEGGN